MKLRICMVLYWPHYNPEMRLDPQIEICSYLRHFGHEITWILWNDEKNNQRPFYFDGIRIFTTPFKNYLPHKWPFADVINVIPNSVRRMQIINKILQQEEFDIVFVRDFAFDGMVAARIKKKKKTKFVFQLTNPIEHFWEAFRIEVPKMLRPFNYVAVNTHGYLAKTLLGKADLILSISQHYKELLITKGIAPSKILVYPSGIDPARYNNVSAGDIRDKYHLEKCKVVIYIGAIAKVRQLDIAIKAFASVAGKSNARLLMVGDGSDVINLKVLSSELGIADKTIFTGQVPQNDIPAYLAAADVGISPVPPSPFFKMSSPIKMLEYMAMARPVVANEEIPEHHDILSVSQAGILVPYTREAFAQAILTLFNDPQKAAEMGRKGKEWVNNNRSYEVMARQVEAGFLNLLK